MNSRRTFTWYANLSIGPEPKIESIWIIYQWQSATRKIRRSQWEAWNSWNEKKNKHKKSKHMRVSNLKKNIFAFLLWRNDALGTRLSLALLNVFQCISLFIAFSKSLLKNHFLKRLSLEQTVSLPLQNLPPKTFQYVVLQQPRS